MSCPIEFNNRCHLVDCMIPDMRMKEDILWLYTCYQWTCKVRWASAFFMQYYSLTWTLKSSTIVDLFNSFIQSIVLSLSRFLIKANVLHMENTCLVTSIKFLSPLEKCNELSVERNFDDRFIFILSFCKQACQTWFFQVFICNHFLFLYVIIFCELTLTCIHLLLTAT